MFSPAADIAVGRVVGVEQLHRDAYSDRPAQHSVTFDDGTTSPTQDQGTYTRTFGAAGTYNYHCSIHGAAMAGTITVQ